MNNLYGKALVVLSGGQDSTTCLAKAVTEFAEVHAITFDYGQKHVRELAAAKEVANIYNVASHEIVEVGPILKGTSPLINANEELEQYADRDSLPGGLEKTYVPHRNMLFLTLAANRAYCIEADALYTGVCQEDFGGYPDCRQVFIDALNQAINLSGDCNIHIRTPLMHLSKAASVMMATELPYCYGALAFTHTAYDGQYPPIGHDHATLLREKGFVEANLPDPLIVRAVSEELMDYPDLDIYKDDDKLADCLNAISSIYELLY